MPRQGKARQVEETMIFSLSLSLLLHALPATPYTQLLIMHQPVFPDWNVSTQPITKSIGPLLFNQEKKKKMEFERGEKH